MSPIDAGISVVIPMYNAERTIASALSSILEQTWPAREVLVVDNGSTDRSAQVAGQYAPAVRVLVEGKRGAAAARNRGAAAATGEHLTFLDADDRMPAERLAMQLDVLRSNRNLAMVFGLQHVFRDGEQPWQEQANCRSRGQIRGGLLPGAMMCRRSAFEQVGPFNEHLQAGEFLEWFARAKDAGLAAAMPEQLALYRRAHDHNLTRNQPATQAEYARALHEVLRRRRGG